MDGWIDLLTSRHICLLGPFIVWKDFRISIHLHLILFLSWKKNAILKRCHLWFFLSTFAIVRNRIAKIHYLLELPVHSTWETQKHCVACDGMPARSICERTRLEQRHRALKITSICQCISLGSGSTEQPDPSHPVSICSCADSHWHHRSHAEQGSSGSRQASRSTPAFLHEEQKALQLVVHAETWLLGFNSCTCPQDRNPKWDLVTSQLLLLDSSKIKSITNWLECFSVTQFSCSMRLF